MKIHVAQTLLCAQWGAAASVARVEMADFIHGGGAKFTFRDVQNILRPHHLADAHLSPVLANEQRWSF